jgi:hypothetical protein
LLAFYHRSDRLDSSNVARLGPWGQYISDLPE